MKINKLYALLLASGLGGFAPQVLADDSVDVGAVNVTGKQTLGNGHMIKEESAKSRSTVTKEAMDEMAPTANALDKLKYTPGINVSSTDATGLSGTSFTMRGMNSDQVGLSSDGFPINDSGDYNIYPNLLGDPENLAEVFVTQGSAEADGPHIGSSGGNIGLVTIRPEKDPGVFVKQALGSNNLHKTFARINTGDLGGFKTWVSASHTEGDKWRGKGSLLADKVEWNTLFEDGNGNSTNAIVKYNRQENYNYNTLSKAQFENQGRRLDYAENTVYNKAGQVLQSFKLNRNPFESVTSSVTQRFQLRDDLSLTFNPYYVWSSGGSYSSQTSTALSSTSDKAGNFDLTGLGANTYYRPSWTETWRPGMTSKLKWDINDEHSLDVGYWYERARQRQTQPYIAIDPGGSPVDIWGDYGASNQLVDRNGKTVQGRHQYTVTPAQKLWIQDTWLATPDLTLTGALAYQYVEREGDNLGSLTDKPEKKDARYHEFLPSFSAKYQIDARNQTFYNVTRNMRTPPNYVLYNKGDSISLKPELSWNQELGWRYSEEAMALSASLFYITFKDRQLSTTDLNGDFVVANVGEVTNKGLELEWSGLLPHNFNYYASYTYTRSEQQDDFKNKGVLLPTSGKQLTNVPQNMLNLSLGYDDNRFYGNVAGKYVGSYYGDLTNDEKIAGRTVVDLNAGVYLPVDKKVFKKATLRFSMLNVFDKEYLASVRTVSFNSQPTNGLAPSTAYYNVGEERTAVVSLEAAF
ncbi:ferrichrome porin FhuA [Pseudomonas sp. FW306-02-F02-AA]|uniref:TonB-dependent receptor n=1 Tax=Pseudomonas fluorescens TaxID=294 RepID=A0A0N9W224_PSEFL|nr:MULTISPECIES: TonB-dependent receptor [Pseudomonas]ALI00421.1 TonB-dependent receptor [Pseudomonas fluorescens]PMZ01223.1 ferrichrome porin FhuA [Pseudomonas sp. FW306-02-F02-AB]PMZ07118.1 ferrichrome porin FhuA [Pseudomonas sp. FW306-02-H06C]PMZ16335.1 ferrichrome porin FhuA [Pseudomonas sp. FW306-02-F02-AA]PMZ22276.1 ferrichrome porin FhuA [Pseudomonas sp. FW306-02-F08-AA]